MNLQKILAATTQQDDADRQYMQVTVLVMRYLDGEVDVYRELKEIARGGHRNGCALGAVPACTCGMKEAQRLIGLINPDPF